MPIILGPDGPSLGGFVCPAVIAQRRIVEDRPAEARAIGSAFAPYRSHWPCGAAAAPRRRRIRARPSRRAADRSLTVVYRRAGDDLSAGRIRPAGARSWAALARACCCMRPLVEAGCPASSISRPASARCRSITTTRSLSQAACSTRCARLKPDLPPVDDDRGCRAASCICRSPGTIEQAELAMRKYQELVRPDAPWCPTNIEFIRRINGLDRIEDGAATSSSTRAISCWASATSISARRSRRRSIRAIGSSRPNTIRRAPGRRKTRSASAAPICASMAWRGRAAISSFGRTIQMWNSWRADADFRRRTSRGCCASSTRSASFR